jgi:hypothetical protein
LVKPVTVIGEKPPVPVKPPGLDVTVYEVIAVPPLLIGGVNVTVASPLPAVAVPIVGASGTVAGTIGLLGAEAILVPIMFVAVTVNVYVVPFVKPVTVKGETPPVAVNPPGLDVTVYEVIAEPPSLPGGVKVTVASPLPRVAVPIVGAPGTLAGTTELLVEEAILVPIAFVAVTVKVYVTPLVKPVTVIGEEPPVPVNPPGLDVTVYEVIAEPPSLPGGVKVTVASPLPAVAVPIVGAPGTLAGTIELLVEEAILVPIAFVAVTVNVYVVPFVKPVTVIGDEPPVPVNPPGLEVTV